MVAANLDKLVEKHSFAPRVYLFLLQHMLFSVVKHSKLLSRHVA